MKDNNMNNNVNNNNELDNTLKCTNCGEDLKFVSNIDNDNYFENAIRRIYICEKCRLSFETTERFNVIKPIVYIIKNDCCEMFSEEKYLKTLKEAMFPVAFETLIQDIVDTWYLYALHNSNAIIQDDDDIRELRVAYTIDTLVEFTVKKLYEAGFESAALDYLSLHRDCLINGGLGIELIQKYNFKVEKEDNHE